MSARWTPEARAKHSEYMRAYFAGLTPDQRAKFSEWGRQRVQRAKGGYCPTKRSERLIVALRVVWLRNLPRPSLDTLAKVCGYGGKTPGTTVCQRISALKRQGIIPDEWWPRHGQPRGIRRRRRARADA